MNFLIKDHFNLTHIYWDIKTKFIILRSKILFLNQFNVIYGKKCLDKGSYKPQNSYFLFLIKLLHYSVSMYFLGKYRPLILEVNNLIYIF